jgi:hypothetical protein
METQYFTHNNTRFIVSPDSTVPDGKTLREHLSFTDEQYAAALAEWQATGETQSNM